MSIRIAQTADGLGFDLSVVGKAIELDDGLETDVCLSLFCDAAATDDELKDAGLTRENNRGWAGDAFAETPDDKWGSKLWLLTRALRTDDTLRLAEDTARESLAWLVEDLIADTVTATASWFENTGFLVLSIAIKRPGELEAKWVRVWNVTTGELMSA